VTKFELATYQELEVIYQLLLCRELTSENLNTLIRWMEDDSKYLTSAKGVISWLRDKPYTDFPMVRQDISRKENGS
jgi:hypothetical protein